MIQAVIFDMDGVLVDSQPLHFQIDIQALAAAGCAANQPLVERYTGLSNPDRWPRYKRDLGLKPAVDELIRLHTNIAMAAFSQEPLTAIPGVRELLALLRAHHLPLALASSSSREMIALVLRRLDLTDFFSVAVSGEEVAAGKPAPDIFLRAAEKLGKTPGCCLAVEDSGNGVLAAQRAGMACLGYVNPHSGAQDLSPAALRADSFLPLCENLDWLENL